MKRSGQINGIVTLVMIFCALCLCIFAVLTYASAERESRLSALGAQRAAQYYEADAQAAEKLAALAEEGLAVGETVRLSFPIGETQTLLVEARRTDTGFAILRWQSKFTGDWETDDSIKVWSGK